MFPIVLSFISYSLKFVLSITLWSWLCYQSMLKECLLATQRARWFLQTETLWPFHYRPLESTSIRLQCLVKDASIATILCCVYVTVFFSWFTTAFFIISISNYLIYFSTFWNSSTFWNTAVNENISSLNSFSEIWTDINFLMQDAFLAGKSQKLLLSSNTLVMISRKIH